MSQTPHKLSMPSFTPVSRGKILLAELLGDWTTKSEKASQEKGDDEHPRMVPKYSPFYPANKSKGPLHPSSSTPTAAKRLKLSPVRDVNSNKISPVPDFLSLYKKDGGDPGTRQSGNNLSTSPVFRSKIQVSSPEHPSPVTSTSIPQSKMDIQMSTASSSSAARRTSGDTRLSPVQTSTHLQNYRQNSSEATKQMDSYIRYIGSFFGIMSRSPIPVHQAIGSSKNCAVITMLEVENLLNRSKDKVDRLMENMQQRMLKFEDIRKNGLVHWGGENEYKWTCLGENEEHQNKSDWKNDWRMVEGMGSRTREASRGKYYVEESAGAGVDVNEVVEKETAEDIYDYDEGDEGIKKQTRNFSKKMHPFIDESDEEEKDGVLLKPKKDKGRGKGRGRGRGRGRGGGRRLGGGNGRLGKKCDQPSNPGVDTYFGTVDEHSQEEVASIADLVISEGVQSKDAENYDETTATVSPTFLDRVNRVLLGTTGEYSRTRTERMGTCPMCSKEMGISSLERHAPECQG